MAKVTKGEREFAFSFAVYLPYMKEPLYPNRPDYQKYQGREDDFQTSVAKYLDLRGFLWMHCPNGGKRGKVEASRLKGQGVKAGFPDICILEARQGYYGLMIELKVGSNVSRPNQLEWAEKLTKRGYKWFWTNSLDEFIEIIEAYFEE